MFYRALLSTFPRQSPGFYLQFNDKCSTFPKYTLCVNTALIQGGNNDRTNYLAE